MTLPSLETTPIPGLVVVRLDRRDDARGFFKENWQREKMLAIGLPDFGPVQNNDSFNSDRGETRGIHTEPWDKFVSLATGRIFGAWVDMREGETFGATFTLEMDTSLAGIAVEGSRPGLFWSLSLMIASDSGIGQSIATVLSSRASAG